MKTLPWFNLVLVMGGFVAMIVGFSRIVPISIDRRFWLMNGPLMVMFTGCALLLRGARKPGMVAGWVKACAGYGGAFMILMALLVMVMAIGTIVTKVYSREIQNFLIEHHVLGPFAAALLSPTSNSLIPVVESAWTVPSLRPMCLYYLQASVLMSFPLFMLRQMGFAKDSVIAPRMYVVGVLASLIMLPLMNPLYRMVDWICRWVK